MSDDPSNRWDYDGSGITTRLRWLNSEESGNYVYCINPGVNEGPGEGAVLLKARLLEEDDFESKALYRACLAALYYAPGGPGYKTEGVSALGRSLFPDTDWRGGVFSFKDRFAAAHCLMGFYYNGADWDNTYPQSNKQPASDYRSWFLKHMAPDRYGGTGNDSYGDLALSHFNDEDMLANGGYTVEAWEESVYLVMTGYADRQDLLTYVDIPHGSLRVQKQSAQNDVTADNPCYSLKGAAYTVYSDAACSKEVGSITVDATGAGTLEGLVAGTYYVKETKAGTGYLPDRETHKVKVSADKVASFTSSEPPRHLPIDIPAAKVDAITGKSEPQGSGSLAGAHFTVRHYAGYFNNENELPDTPAKTWKDLKTGEDGRVLKDINLPLGTFTVQETAAPLGYTLNNKLYIGQIVADDDAPQGARLKAINYSTDDSVEGRNTPIVPDKPKTCGFKLSKLDALMDGPQPEGDASLAGAVFAVVNESEHPVRIDGLDYEKGEVCLTVATTSAGDSCVAQCDGGTLPFGSYTIREQEPPTGYLPNEAWQTSIKADESLEDGHIFDFGSTPCEDQPICGGIAIPKIDREIQRFAPLGAATLEGAEFSISLVSDQPVKVGGSIFQPGETVKIVTTGSDGIAATDEHDLPYATYRVRETKAPTGYLLNTEWEDTVEVRDDGRVYTTKAADDQVKRGDVRLNKVHADSMARMGRVAFLVTSKTTGEQHVLVCDENGNLDTSASWIPHTNATNANDRALGAAASEPEAVSDSSEANGDGAAADNPESATTSESISGDTPSETTDDDVVLPSETEPESPAVAESSTTLEGEDTAAEGDSGAARSEDSPAGEAPDSPDTEQAGDGAAPTGGDTSFDMDALAAALAEVLGADSVVIEDSNGLGTSLDAAAPGTDVQFSATIATGDSTEQCIFIATPEEDGSLSIRDADTDDEVLFLDAGDEADDHGSGSGAGNDGGESGSDSSPNQDPDDGHGSPSSDSEIPEPTDSPGSPVTGTDGGDADSSSLDIDDGQLDLEAGVWFSGRADEATEPNDALGALPYDTYTFQELRSMANQGMRLVQFEVTVHRDSQDIDMGTVDDSPITICTELTSPAGTHLAPSTGSVSLTDTVSYTGLSAGKRYELRGCLVDKTTGTQVGETSYVAFVPETADGSVDVPLEVDGSAHAGKELVAYQELLEEGTLVAEHKDLDDAAETISIPAIATTLTSSDGRKSVVAQKKTTLVDRVDFTGLVPGMQYTLKAALHVNGENGRDTGVLKDAHGTEVRAEITFTPQSARGFESVPFTFDATGFAGQAVAFEELWCGDVLYAEHKDISDDGQTVDLTSKPPKDTPEPEPNPEPPKEQTTPPPTTPSKTPGKGQPYPKTGDVLAQYWLLLGLTGCTGAISAAYALLTRKPAYSSWG
ncbi:MAG: SpaA isopeptide-forming pilin-related protein [Coriobacteriia bacterium]|nr:SpaA isopeptide-forming pilin-related protein [Coriobacteriia bacterium]